MDLLLLEVMIQIPMHALQLNTSGWFLRLQIILLPHSQCSLFITLLLSNKLCTQASKLKYFVCPFFSYTTTLNYYVLTVLFMKIMYVCFLASKVSKNEMVAQSKASLCRSKNLKTRVIGCPKTIDGDLKCKEVPTSFGFDTACKVPCLVLYTQVFVVSIKFCNPF